MPGREPAALHATGGGRLDQRGLHAALLSVCRQQLDLHQEALAFPSATTFAAPLTGTLRFAPGGRIRHQHLWRKGRLELLHDLAESIHQRIGQLELLHTHSFRFPSHSVRTGSHTMSPTRIVLGATTRASSTTTFAYDSGHRRSRPYQSCAFVNSAKLLLDRAEVLQQSVRQFELFHAFPGQTVIPAP